MTLPELRDLLTSTGIPTFHYIAEKSSGKYIVWAEDGQGTGTHFDNRLALQGIQGTIDFFTKDEYDPDFERIQTKLNTGGIAWKLNSIQFEEVTGYTHYEWTFEVVNSVG